MPEDILFLTGRLARPSLARVLDGIEPRAFTHHVHDLGLSVAALMTTDMIQRRLGDTMGADRIIVRTPATNPRSVNTIMNHGKVPRAVSSPNPIAKPIPRPATSSITSRQAICAWE